VAADISGRGGQAIAVEMDHARAADCSRTVSATREGFGVKTVDVLVNNAGIVVQGAALDIEEDDLLRAFRVNVVGPYLMTCAVLPSMVVAGGGSIVMIASAAGLQARQAGAAYVTSKHALVGLTRSLAADYARTGIRVNAVCPGVIRTRMSEELFEYRAQRLGTTVEQVAEEVAQEFPLGRLGRPEDVAGAALHFASDESSWVTGETYLLDGGQVLLGPRRPLPDEPPARST
jgi:NAD(P)-dependent dehydrogenase (short-subunit alcohol dehydrogenase family)